MTVDEDSPIEDDNPRQIANRVLHFNTLGRVQAYIGLAKTMSKMSPPGVKAGKINFSA